MTERKRLALLVGATAISILLATLASRFPAPAPLVAGIGVIPLALLLMLWRRCTPAAQTRDASLPAATPAPPRRASTWAAAMLDEIKSAAVLCDHASHRVIGANAAAAALFGPVPAEGAPLAQALPPALVETALAGLRLGETAPLSCPAGIDQRHHDGHVRQLEGAYLLVLDASPSPLAPQPKEPQSASPPRSTTDLSSQNLYNALAHRLASTHLRLNMVGIPLWLHGEDEALLAALTSLVQQLSQTTGQREFDFEALLADRQVFLDLGWQGTVVGADTVAAWLEQPADDRAETVGQVLDRHDTEPWSQKLDDTVSVLRLPLPPPQRLQFRNGDRLCPLRPEIHDLALLERYLRPGERAHVPLTALSCVAFASETTGWRPDRGDRLVQLAALRVEHRQIAAEDGFVQWINPGRPVPPSIRSCDGIDDTVLQSQPPLTVVLPQFAAFAGNSVLVGHNLGFDLSFFDAVQGETGIALRNPVLDVMILAALTASATDLSLPALATRFGLPWPERPSAVTSTRLIAEILLRLHDPLATLGIRTLAQACQASLDWLTQGRR